MDNVIIYIYIYNPDLETFTRYQLEMMGYANVHIILLLICILGQSDGLAGNKTGKYQI